MSVCVIHLNILRFSKSVLPDLWSLFSFFTELCNHSSFQGSRLFVTYTIIQGIISSEMEVRTGPLNGQCKKIKIKDDT